MQLEIAAILAQVHLVAGRVAEALALTESAMRWLEATGSAGHAEALLRLLHAQALARSSHSEEAGRRMRVARSRLIFRADRITDPALRKSFLERVPENAATLADT